MVKIFSEARSLWYGLVAVFIAVLYGPHVSPVLGMGTSAMLSTAVTSGGMAPVPNYPVHNLISRVFLLLPGARPDYVMNLVSFVMATLTILLLVRLLLQVAEALEGRRLPAYWVGFTGLLIAFLYFQSPGLARVTHFGDRYTTDHFFLLLAASVFVDGLVSARVSRRHLVGSAFFLVFTFFCHPKSIPLPWFFCTLLSVRAWRQGTRPPLLAMTGAALLGALPVLYLPLLSSTDPLFDWGNPETLREVYGSLVRKEYAGIHLTRTLSEAWADWGRQYRLLGQQFAPAVFALFALGIATLLSRNWRALAVVAGLLLLTGEWISFLQHYDNPNHDPLLSATFDWYMINYYSSYFLVVLAVAALGVLLALQRLPLRPQHLALPACALLLLSFHFKMHDRNSYADYGLSTELAENFEAVVPEGAILFTHVDSLFAPLMYNQLHHGRLPNRYILHMELMFRSWYYNDIERLYPELWQRNEVLFTRLKAFFLEFERSGYDERGFDINVYTEGLNRLAASHMEQGTYLFVDPETHPLRAGLFRSFQWEPEVLVFRLHRSSYRIADIPFERLRFSALKSLAMKQDYWASRFQTLFGRIGDLRLQRSRMMHSQEAGRLEALLSELQ